MPTVEMRCAQSCYRTMHSHKHQLHIWLHAAVLLHHALFAPVSYICVWLVLLMPLVMTRIARSWHELPCRCSGSCCQCICISPLSWHTCTILVLDCWHTCTILVLSCLAQHTTIPSLMRTAHLQCIYLPGPHCHDRADDTSNNCMTKSNHKPKQVSHEMRCPLFTGWADPSAHGRQWEAGWGPRWTPCLHRPPTLLQGQHGAP